MADDDARREREREQVMADAIREAKHAARNEVQIALRDVLREHGDSIRAICREVFAAQTAADWDVRPEDFRTMRVEIRDAAAAHKAGRELRGTAVKTMVEEVVKTAIAALVTAGAVIYAIRGFH